MRFENQPFAASPAPSWGAVSVGLTSEGLIFGPHSVLVRMAKTGGGTSRLALDDDEGRLLTLLSIAQGQPAAAARVLPPIEVAAAHWHHGDKALANLRLVFADLPRLRDPSDADRLCLAESLLDAGMSPAALMAELWPGSKSNELEKYNPAHVPAGHGRRSGQFDFRSGPSRPTDERIIVADESDKKEIKERELFGETPPKLEFKQGHPVTPTTGIPIVGSQGGAAGGLRTVDTLSSVARAAAAKVGPGKGPVYRTAVHTELKDQVKGLGRQDLCSEQSYLDGECVRYGTSGSVRVDIAEPTALAPKAVYDLKTGGATLTSARKKQFRTHLPKRDDGEEVEIHEIRP